MIRTYKYRLYPTKPQEQRLFQVLAVCRHWHNMCLEERKLAYELEGRTVSKNEQIIRSRQYRQTFPQAKVVFSQTLQQVAINLDKAFQAFFRRIKAGETPGYPRFKGHNRFNSFVFPQFGVGARLDGNHRLRLFEIGRVRVRWHREIHDNGTIKTCRIKYEAGQWYVSSRSNCLMRLNYLRLGMSSDWIWASRHYSLHRKARKLRTRTTIVLDNSACAF